MALLPVSIAWPAGQPDATGDDERNPKSDPGEDGTFIGKEGEVGFELWGFALFRPHFEAER